MLHSTSQPVCDLLERWSTQLAHQERSFCGDGIWGILRQDQPVVADVILVLEGYYNKRLIVVFGQLGASLPLLPLVHD